MIKFLKMNGNGNDFVIIDCREQDFTPTPHQISWISYRRFGIGCDQLIILRNSSKADVFMEVYNADGSQSGACGNATRCVGYLIMGITKDEAKIETKSGILIATRAPNDEVTVNMGEPILQWDKIPLSREVDIMELPIEMGPLVKPVAVSMGNPHMVFFVDNVSGFKLRQYGRHLEKHELFPERCNVSAVQIISRTHLKMKIWERGVGKTLSCGTAACAALVAAQLHDLADNKAVVEQPGGKLTIEWQDGGNVLMTGKVAVSFKGEFDPQDFPLERPDAE
jgi:diaminopimelate epimerase